ncbi:thioesterase family protein [Acinetobacter stercoris]|uniref:Thioesterase family protein n=1 Tax=Acinetobacter stercoris TaxID=2126983 RepID=A0A2U3MTV1_9GAMM|nr:thioesterase family protein [Acinetobacter stercoris]SPL68868.1 hypothetical protein KPC_0046 [Acinetobacter stercoris]
MSLEQIYQDIENKEWVDIPKGWSQGRTIYGGLVAGMLLYKAVHTVNDDHKKLLSTSITFVGPVQEESVKLTAEILRQGKSVTTIEVRLWQHDAVQSILIASFGTPRESTIEVYQERIAPDYPDVAHLNIMPKSVPTPECFKQFQLAWAEGHYPLTASEQPDFGGWFRFDPELHRQRKMNVSDVVTLLDVWPPGVLPLFKMPAPSSSLTWHISFIHPLNHDLDAWFKYKVFTDYAMQGYSTEYAHFWDENNQLIAISRQTVTVFT